MLAAGAYVFKLVIGGGWCSDGERVQGERTMAIAEEQVEDEQEEELDDVQVESPRRKILHSQEEDERSACSPLSKKSKVVSHLKFCCPLTEEHVVPMLHEYPLAVRREMFWSYTDYAQIREKQRKLIEVVMRQASELPPGTVPPPIPGESRRGLGICCEPSTNSSRAARVRSARRAIVEAQREGCTSEQLSLLACELSRWATKNAFDVGRKDQEAIADFDYSSFERQQSSKLAGLINPPATETPSMQRPLFGPTSPRSEHKKLNQGKELERAPSLPTNVARALRRTDSDLGPSPSSSPPRQISEERDGLGLASMIRNDSLGDLVQNSGEAAAAAALANANNEIQRGNEQVPAKEDTQDGLGLASMIRNDSLGNLAAVAAALG